MGSNGTPRLVGLVVVAAGVTGFLVAAMTGASPAVAQPQWGQCGHLKTKKERCSCCMGLPWRYGFTTSPGSPERLAACRRNGRC